MDVIIIGLIGDRFRNHESSYRKIEKSWSIEFWVCKFPIAFELWVAYRYWGACQIRKRCENLRFQTLPWHHIDGLAQDCSISIVDALEILQPCIKPSIWESCSYVYSWWRDQMETFSALLALCAGNSPVTGEFPSQRPVTRSFDVFFDLHLNKRLSKQSWGWWFETPSRPLWRHCNVWLHVMS